jgi:hypothetical protein
VKESRTHGRAACALARLAVRPWIPPLRPGPWSRPWSAVVVAGVSYDHGYDMIIINKLTQIIA